LLKWPGLGKISRLSDWNRELMPQVFVIRLRLPRVNHKALLEKLLFTNPAETQRLVHCTVLVRIIPTSRRHRLDNIDEWL
jgi:hypothetical protein